MCDAEKAPSELKKYVLPHQTDVTQHGEAEAKKDVLPVLPMGVIQSGSKEDDEDERDDGKDLHDGGGDARVGIGEVTAVDVNAEEVETGKGQERDGTQRHDDGGDKPGTHSTKISNCGRFCDLRSLDTFL